MRQQLICISTCLLLFLMFGVSGLQKLHAQNTDTYITEVDTSLIYKVTKYSRVYYIGQILSIDEREVVMVLPVRGKLVIPAHEIKSIEVMDKVAFDGTGNYIDPKTDLTHFIFNTNALGLKKNEVEVSVNYLGPDLIFGLSDRKSLRIATTWVAAPVGMTYSYQIPLDEKLNLSLGIMGTWFSWFEIENGIILPYAGLTMGTARKNITLTGGYGRTVNWEGAFNMPYFSLSGITPIGKNWKLLFDSYLTEELVGRYNFTTNRTYSKTVYQGMALVATRWNFARSAHLQLGGGIFLWDTYLYPAPVVQLFIKI